MDFSAFNPLSSNKLNMAARNDDVAAVENLLKTCNPNYTDNRGWTCLHEAAAYNSINSLRLIIKHPECRLLAESFEGETALYVACQRKSSLEVIKTLLENIKDIANYAITEMVTPLHVVSSQGNTDAIQLLLEYGAMVDVQDFDGDTPLHDAANNGHTQAVEMLLHAGAVADVPNNNNFTPLHLACYSGSLDCVHILVNFTTNVNCISNNSNTPLIIAIHNASLPIVKLLFDYNADGTIQYEGRNAVETAILRGDTDVFKYVLDKMGPNNLSLSILETVCQPTYFNRHIILSLLESDIDMKYFHKMKYYADGLSKVVGFNYHLCFNIFIAIADYIFINSRDYFEKIMFLFLMRGIPVNVTLREEHPPMVCLASSPHENCYERIYEVLVQHGYDFNYCSGVFESKLPDALDSAMTMENSLASRIIPYVFNNPEDVLLVKKESERDTRKFTNIAKLSLMRMLDSSINCHDDYTRLIPPLQHLTRSIIRKRIGQRGAQSTRQFYRNLNKLPLPKYIIDYLKYHPDKFYSY